MGYISYYTPDLSSTSKEILMQEEIIRHYISHILERRFKTLHYMVSYQRVNEARFLLNV